VRCKYCINPVFFSLFHISGKVARIVAQIFVRAELGGIDEQTDDNPLGHGFAMAHEGAVPLVEKAHGGHQTNGLSPPSPLPELLSQR
jgi:hypothetical protein